MLHPKQNKSNDRKTLIIHEKSELKRNQSVESFGKFSQNSLMSQGKKENLRYHQLPEESPEK